jgi:hypothetical protein
MLILDMIEVLPPFGKYKYDTWRILPVKCYIDNSVRLRSYISNVNTSSVTRLRRSSSPVLAIILSVAFVKEIDYSEQT